ncbi:uncharacterized protein MELLADRAFT_101594 [Melampsora larici-populina 98AG31]|uniref:Secreted protein n=1 Tax=Melampsora larici-populina (strain 98AG31 / pathotype 3-4-7) TaxID=747676 RepID=F4R6C6_MELLP|nr:uncharacterized protein MELLADRAFT_101594 [Melampsora larici-populina 98AG31]EGG11855.1 secreted protein [Melampsora larici-populina 98AG31]
MLLGFLKISLVLFSLMIHDVLGDEPAPVRDCIHKLALTGNGRAGCTAADGHTYDCAAKSCWCQGHNYIRMTECQLVGSRDKGFSTQDCVQTEWIHSDLTKQYRTCINPRGVPYNCAFNAHNIPLNIGCMDCKA